MALFTEDFLTELAEKNDIVDVVGSYVNLSKRSGSNYFGLCPFHNEKTPSFSVSPSRQIYHCFGCGKGGGVINFIMEIENDSFPEAVALLAERAKMPMPEDSSDDEYSKKRERIYSANREAAKFYFGMLTGESGKPAREYLARRKISAATAKDFGLGYAPESWDSLYKALKAKGYSDAELIDANLVSRGKKGGCYDRFRNRLMFPVINTSRKVIGFSGRAMGDNEPKYLNTAETAAFNKGRNLFGLNIAKNSKADYFLLVEGNVDVVSLHQAGFNSAVASLGTSLTDEQARLLSRYKNELVIAYDADSAGLKASQRAINMLQKLDVKVRVLSIPEGKDPDEYIKAKGADAFRNLVERSESQTDYTLRTIAGKYDLSVPDQKSAYLKEVTKALAAMPSQMDRELYSSVIAEKAGISAGAVKSTVERQRSVMLKTAKSKERPKAEAQPAGTDVKYENPESAKAEEGVIRLLLLDPSVAAKCDLDPGDFSSPELGHIYSILKENVSASVNYLSSLLTKDEMSILINIQEQPENLSEAGRILSDYVSKIRNKPTDDLIELRKKLLEGGKNYR